MAGVTPLPQQKDKAGVGIGTRMTLVTALVAIVVFVFVFKVLSFGNLRHEPVWAAYGFVITGFIFMRFLLGFCYRPRRTVLTGGRGPALIGALQGTGLLTLITGILLATGLALSA